MTTVESKVCFWDKRCICTFAVTASLCSFNSFLESSLVFLYFRFYLFRSFLCLIMGGKGGIKLHFLGIFTPYSI